MRAYPERLATPSCTRAPPESLMKTNGVPVFMDAFMVSAILSACTSPAEPPATVKSWLATCTGRPAIRPRPVTAPSAGKSLSAMPKNLPLCLANNPASWKESRSSNRVTRSRAVSFPLLCCFAARSSPPPSFSRSRICPRSEILSVVIRYSSVLYLNIRKLLQKPALHGRTDDRFVSSVTLFWVGKFSDLIWLRMHPRLAVGAAQQAVGLVVRTTRPAVASHASVRPSFIERFARMQLAVEMYPCSISATGLPRVAMAARKSLM